VLVTHQLPFVASDVFVMASFFAELQRFFLQLPNLNALQFRKACFSVYEDTIALGLVFLL
jgi:hypothetical protein